MRRLILAMEYLDPRLIWVLLRQINFLRLPENHRYRSWMKRERINSVIYKAKCPSGLQSTLHNPTHRTKPRLPLSNQDSPHRNYPTNDHSPGHFLLTNSPVFLQTGFFPNMSTLKLASCSGHFIYVSISSTRPGPEQDSFRSLRWNSETSLQPQV